MPFVELLAPPLPDGPRRAVATAIADAICTAYGVKREIVTTYFLDIPPASYAHAGVLGADPAGQRIFLKLHAYRRTVEARRAVAAALTTPLARHYRVPEAAVAVYFLDRAPDEVAHAGALSSDVHEPA